MANLGLVTRSLFLRRIVHLRVVSLPSYPKCQRDSSTLTGIHTSGRSFILNNGIGNSSHMTICNNYLVNTSQKRFKKRRGQRKSTDEDSDDEKDDEDNEENPLLSDSSIDGLPKDYEEKAIEVVSLRLDAVAHVVFGKTRQRIEEAIYKRELLVNRELPTKKSMELQEGDDICLIIRKEEDDTVTAMRVLIDSVHDLMTSKGRTRVTIHRWPKYTMPPKPVEQ